MLSLTGSIDPWQPLGVVKSLAEDQIAIYINGTSHCTDIYPADKYDTPELRKAQQVVSL